VTPRTALSATYIAGIRLRETIAYNRPTIKFVGNTASCAQTLTATPNDSGKPQGADQDPGVWQQQGGEWKLLARQAVRVAA